MKRTPRVFSVRIALACLVFAVLVAVGSVPLLAWRAWAWRLALSWNKIELYEFDDPKHGPTSVSAQRLFGSAIWMHAPVQPPLQGAPTPFVVASDPRPSWALPVSDPWPDMHFAFSAGLPFPSARGWFEVPGSSEQVFRGFYLARPPSRMLSLRARNNAVYLPIVPRWPGLLANTLVFFLIPFLPWTLWRWRRFSQIERLGLCYGCRYEFPREIETCPECGTTRPPARKRSR